MLPSGFASQEGPSMTDTETGDLNAVFNEILEGCADQGMQFTLIVCWVSQNGRVSVVRVKGDGTLAETLAEHFEGEGFVLPMTVTVVDQRNEVVNVTIAASGQPTWH